MYEGVSKSFRIIQGPIQTVNGSTLPIRVNRKWLPISLTILPYAFVRAFVWIDITNIAQINIPIIHKRNTHPCMWEERSFCASRTFERAVCVCAIACGSLRESLAIVKAIDTNSRLGGEWSKYRELCIVRHYYLLSRAVFGGSASMLDLK